MNTAAGTLLLPYELIRLRADTPVEHEPISSVPICLWNPRWHRTATRQRPKYCTVPIRTCQEDTTMNTALYPKSVFPPTHPTHDTRLDLRTPGGGEGGHRHRHRPRGRGLPGGNIVWMVIGSRRAAKSEQGGRTSSSNASPSSEDCSEAGDRGWAILRARRASSLTIK